MIETTFHEAFGHAPDATIFTPGRVNLIGEHTDYNGGQVLPTALHRGVTLAVSSRMDRRVRIISEGFDGLADRLLSDTAQDHWSDYIVGALQLAKAQGFGPEGANVAVATDLPVGAGLSSSAAVTVGTLDAAQVLSGTERPRRDIALLARQVENDFIGVPCGIMDQMAVAISKPGQALSLDTKTLDYELIDLPKDYHFAVIHSGIHRKLSDGRYKIRKEECDAIKRIIGHDDICLISKAALRALSEVDPVLFRRARHCRVEHMSTILAAAKLHNEDIHDMEAFGIHMNESHRSMRDDFEITVPAINSLVEDAQAFGAMGARMTGGGFGGCMVACVAKDQVEVWKDRLLRAHPAASWVC